VILDADLARIYGVETRAFNRAVRRNTDRFPRDFIFQLTREEFDNLKYQFGTSSFLHGGRRKLPLAFTENGAVMSANILNSPKAVRMSVFVVRAFVKMRGILVGQSPARGAVSGAGTKAHWPPRYPRSCYCGRAAGHHAAA